MIYSEPYLFSYASSANLAVKECIEHFNKVFFSLLGTKTSDVWVAGGSVKDYFLQNKPKDIDVYCSSPSSYEETKQTLLKKGFNIQFQTENTLRLISASKKVKLDLITILSPTPIDCIKEFDFTIISAAVTYNAFFYHRDFFTDNLSKKLIINTLQPYLGVLFRFQKYIKKGYTMPTEELRKLGHFINSLDLKNPDQEKIFGTVIGSGEENFDENIPF